MGEWIGTDFDGTLAYYEGWLGETTFGVPIPRMVKRIQNWLAAGIEVRIVTARVGVANDPHSTETIGIPAITKAIEDWCEKHIGVRLPVTCSKDMGMIELWDDRAVQVIVNTGEPVTTILPKPWEAPWVDEESIKTLKPQSAKGCTKCGGEGWLWSHELEDADEETLRDTMTHYSCDACN